jgi:hypothetical protein
MTSPLLDHPLAGFIMFHRRLSAHRALLAWGAGL